MASLLRRTLRELEHWRTKDWTFAEVGAHWDSTEDYDDINSETYSYARRFEDGLRLSRLPLKGPALDVCARTGNGATFFHQRTKLAPIVCADVSFKMGAICRARLELARVPSWMWVPLGQSTLPFADDSFETVLCFETVEHFPRPGLFVRELGRVTRPGGHLVLTTPNVLWEPIHALAAITQLHHSEGPHRFVSLSSLTAMVLAADFEIDRIETTVLVPGGPRILIRVGEWIEDHTRETLMPLLGLRRVVIATKLG